MKIAWLGGWLVVLGMAGCGPTLPAATPDGSAPMDTGILVDGAAVPDAAADARVFTWDAAALPLGASLSPDGEGICCEPAVGCNCGSNGGFTTDPAECSRSGWCDLHPLDTEWLVDVHGCRSRQPAPGGVRHCCACPPDR